MTPTVAIVIRAKNEAAWLGATLAALRGQTWTDWETIVVDSGSTDRTPAIALAGGARLLAIQAADFTYGRSLNVGIDGTAAPLIVSLSAHATPATDRWLATLIAPFADPRIGAVYGRHIPRPNATFLEKLGMRLSGTLGRRRRIQRRGISFSNANGAFRRALWAEQPFDETLPGAEDFAWAQLILRRGQVIAYEPDAAVYHSHGESLGNLLRRVRQDQPVIARAWLGRLNADPARTRWPIPVRLLTAAPVTAADRPPERSAVP